MIIITFKLGKPCYNKFNEVSKLAKTFFVLDDNLETLVNFDVGDDDDASAIGDSLTMEVNHQATGTLDLVSAFDTNGNKKDKSLIKNNCSFPGFVETIPTLKLNYAQSSSQYIGDLLGQFELTRVIIPLDRIKSIAIAEL